MAARLAAASDRRVTVERLKKRSQFDLCEFDRARPAEEPLIKPDNRQKNRRIGGLRAGFGLESNRLDQIDRKRKG